MAFRDVDPSRKGRDLLLVPDPKGKSHVREMAGIKTTGWNYSQSAVICTVGHTIENHCACAWQRFLPSGPIALLPIGDKFSNIVWTMKPEELLAHKSMNSDDFVKAVNLALDHGYGSHPHSGFLDQYMDIFSWFAGKRTISTEECFQVPPKVTKVISDRLAFPLPLMHAHEYASKRVVLIGHAAHVVHPLAGQGVNLGFGDASALSNIIAEGLSVGADIGKLLAVRGVAPANSSITARPCDGSAMLGFWLRWFAPSLLGHVMDLRC